MRFTEINAARIMLIIALLSGVIFRFHDLETIPGLDHDEALIGIGARMIAENSIFPLTGDKTYEGPFMEYIVALLFRGWGSSVSSLRFPTAFAGSLSIIIMFFIGKSIRPSAAGFLALITASSPWSVAVSRIAYTANLGFLFLMLATWIFIQKGVFESWKKALIFGVLCGLAMNGRITAATLLLTFILFSVAKRRYSAAVLSISGSVFCSIPLLIFNCRHNFPAIDILTGSQAHLVAVNSGFIEGYLSRIYGFLKTLGFALNSNYFWLDQPIIRNRWYDVIPLLAVTGMVAVCLELFRGNAKKEMHVSKVISTWMLIAFFLVPSVSKQLTSGRLAGLFHPHYLDMVMIQAYFMIAYGLNYFISKLKNRAVQMYLICLSGFLIFGIQSQILVGKIYPDCKQSGGWGRWNRCYQDAADYIRTTFSHEDFTVIANYEFGAGYPQLKFLLNQWRIEPYLSEFTGLYDRSGNLKTGNILHVVRDPDDAILPGEKLWSAETQSRAPVSIFKFSSPGLFIDGVIGTKNKSYRLYLSAEKDKTGIWKTLGSIVLPEETIPSDSVNILARVDSLQTIPSIQNLLDSVSPRHKPELEKIGRWITGFKLDIKNNDQVCNFLADLRSNQWDVTWIDESKEISGPFYGRLRLY